MDWPGLLKWSLNHHDGTTASSHAQMSEENRQFFADAMKRYTFDEVEQMKIISNVLQVPDDPSNPEDVIKKEDSLETLSGLIDNLDSAINFHKIGGFVPLMNAMITSEYDSIKRGAADVFALSCQNNSFCQDAAQEYGILGYIVQAWTGQNVKVREMYAAALSSLMRGLSFTAKMVFIKEFDGVTFIHNCLRDPTSSLKIKKKLSFLLMDLLYYDIEYNVRQQVAITEWAAVLITSIEDATKTDWDHRTFSLKILRTISRFNIKVMLPFRTKLGTLRVVLDKSALQNPDDRDMYEEHLTLLKEIVYPGKERDDIYEPANNEERTILSFK